MGADSVSLAFKRLGFFMSFGLGGFIVSWSWLKPEATYGDIVPWFFGILISIAGCVVRSFFLRWKFKNWFSLEADTVWTIRQQDGPLTIQTGKESVDLFVRVVARGKTDIRECDLRFVVAALSPTWKSWGNVIGWSAPSDIISIRCAYQIRNGKPFPNVAQFLGDGNLTLFFSDPVNISRNDALHLGIQAHVTESWEGCISFEGHNPAGERVYARFPIRIIRAAE